MIITDMGKFYNSHFEPYKKVIESTGCETELRFFGTCDELIEAGNDGDIDVAATRSACYLRARQMLGVESFAAFGSNKTLMHRATILVKNNSPFDKFEDLRGAVFSTIKSSSFEYNIYPRYLLKKRIGEKSGEFFSEVMKCPSIFSAIYSVVYSEADAVVVDEEYLNIKLVSDNLRPIEYSFDVPYPVIYVFPGHDKSIVDDTSNFLRSILKLPKESKYIGNFFRLNASVLWVTDSDFDAFREDMQDKGLLELVMEKSGAAASGE